MRDVHWDSHAWEEYLALQQNKALFRRVNLLIKDIQRNGYEATAGKVEMLSGDLAGKASVRLDKKNRIVFDVTEDAVEIAQCGGHYDDH